MRGGSMAESALHRILVAYFGALMGLGFRFNRRKKSICACMN